MKKSIRQIDAGEDLVIWEVVVNFFEEPNTISAFATMIVFFCFKKAKGVKFKEYVISLQEKAANINATLSEIVTITPHLVLVALLHWTRLSDSGYTPTIQLLNKSKHMSLDYAIQELTETAQLLESSSAFAAEQSNMIRSNARRGNNNNSNANAVNDGNCRNWLTTGVCRFGDQCRYKHLADTKGRRNEKWATNVVH